MNSHGITPLLLFSVMLSSNLSANAQKPNPITGVRQETTTISVGEIPVAEIPVGELTQYLRDGKKFSKRLPPLIPN